MSECPKCAEYAERVSQLEMEYSRLQEHAQTEYERLREALGFMQLFCQGHGFDEHAEMIGKALQSRQVDSESSRVAPVEDRGGSGGATLNPPAQLSCAPVLTVERAVTVIRWSMLAKGQNIHPAAKVAYEEAILAVQTHDSSSPVMGESTRQACYQRIENDMRKNCYSRSSESCELVGGRCAHCGRTTEEVARRAQTQQVDQVSDGGEKTRPTPVGGVSAHVTHRNADRSSDPAQPGESTRQASHTDDCIYHKGWWDCVSRCPTQSQHVPAGEAAGTGRQNDNGRGSPEINALPAAHTQHAYESVKRGLEQAAQGEVRSLGSFVPSLGSKLPPTDRAERYRKAAELIKLWANEPGDYDEKIMALLEQTEPVNPAEEK